MSRLSGSLKSFLCAHMCVCVCVGCDETLSLTQCCSVKVKPYRMSGMMTRTERFHLIPPFPLFSCVPPICLPSFHLRPRSLTRQDRHTLAFTYSLHQNSSWVCLSARARVCVHVCMSVCLNSVKPCHPTSKAKSEMPEATVSVSAWLAWSLQPAVKHLCFIPHQQHIYLSFLGLQLML